VGHPAVTGNLEEVH